jgi:hypothetical protein
MLDRYGAFELRRTVTGDAYHGLPNDRVSMLELANAVADLVIQHDQVAAWFAAARVARRNFRAELDALEPRVQALARGGPGGGHDEADATAVERLQIQLGTTSAAARWPGAAGVGRRTLGEVPEALRRLAAQVRESPWSSEKCAALGNALTAALFADGILASFANAYQGAVAAERPLRIELEVQAESAWGDLPWELATLPGQPNAFLVTATEVEFVRVLPPPPGGFHPVIASEDRLLVVACPPPHAGDIDVRKEAHAIRDLWADAGKQVVVLENPTRRALARKMLEGPWTVVHIATHGTPGVIELAEPVSAARLAQTLARRVSSTVFINTCHGNSPMPEVDHPGRAWRSTAGYLLANGVAHTVATGAVIPDEDGFDAAVAWHTAFLDSGDPVAATAEAREELGALSDAHAFGFLAHLTLGGDQ